MQVSNCAKLGDAARSTGWRARVRRSTGVAAILAAATVVAGACGGEGGGATAGSGDGATKLKVAYVPAVTYPYVWRAYEAGYFADEGLDVELTPMAGGLEIIRAIEGGSVQFGGADVIGTISAVNAGVPVQFVIVPSYATARSPIDAVMTNDPSVRTPADLAGKTLAVNLKFNIDWLLIREWLEMKGVPPDEVEIVEVPFPDMPNAIGERTVAAAAPVEPFVTISNDDGYRNLGYYWAEIADSILVSGIVGNTDYMSANPDVTERFSRALRKGVADVSDNPQLTRRLLREYTEIPPPILGQVNLPEFRTDANTQKGIDFWLERAKAEGLIPADASPRVLAPVAEGGKG